MAPEVKPTMKRIYSLPWGIVDYINLYPNNGLFLEGSFEKKVVDSDFQTFVVAFGHQMMACNSKE